MMVITCYHGADRPAACSVFFHDFCKHFLGMQHPFHVSGFSITQAAAEVGAIAVVNSTLGGGYLSHNWAQQSTHRTWPATTVHSSHLFLSATSSMYVPNAGRTGAELLITTPGGAGGRRGGARAAAGACSCSHRSRSLFRARAFSISSFALGCRLLLVDPGAAPASSRRGRGSNQPPDF